ncbi:MAG: lasso peptide biosynthesis B2 protein [Crocinitomicaceae bacterium]|nr:lasso peptide biosynthesis B2 protein [Crocinitomicaceae bacterium]
MRSYFNLPKNEKRLLREAVFHLFLTKIQLKFHSFKFYSEKLVSTGTIENHPEEELKEIRVAIRRANKISFWKNKCLVSTLTARKMLNKRNIKSTAHLTLQKDKMNDTLNAHSWIHSNNTSLVFDEPGFVIVHTF